MVALLVVKIVTIFSIFYNKLDYTYLCLCFLFFYSFIFALSIYSLSRKYKDYKEINKIILFSYWLSRMSCKAFHLQQKDKVVKMRPLVYLPWTAALTNQSRCFGQSESATQTMGGASLHLCHIIANFLKLFRFYLKTNLMK